MGKVVPGLLFLFLSLQLFSISAVGRVNGKIAFTTIADGHREIFAMDSDGGNLRRLVNGPSNNDFAAWSPDGKRLAYLSQTDASSYAIVIVNADGSDAKHLTTVSFDGVFDPWWGGHWGMSWSPDGTKIAYTETVGAGDREIFVINTDGTGRRDLSNNAALDSHPSWSPDGTRILFCSSRYRGQYAFRLFSMNPDGGDQAIVSDYQGNYTGDVDPAWSPDGRSIAGVQLWLLDVGVFFVQGQDSFLDWTIERDSSTPTWSPDGRQVIYSSVVSPYVPPASQTELFRLDLDRAQLVQVTRMGYAAHPAWQRAPKLALTGRVRGPQGAPLRNAVVTITDGAGVESSVLTSSFGNFTFDGLDDGEQFVVRVNSRRYTFAPRTVTLSSGLGPVEFVGQE